MRNSPCFIPHFRWRPLGPSQYFCSMDVSRVKVSKYTMKQLWAQSLLPHCWHQADSRVELKQARASEIVQVGSENWGNLKGRLTKSLSAKTPNHWLSGQVCVKVRIAHSSYLLSRQEEVLASPPSSASKDCTHSSWKDPVMVLCILVPWRLSYCNRDSPGNFSYVHKELFSLSLLAQAARAQPIPSVLFTPSCCFISYQLQFKVLEPNPGLGGKSKPVWPCSTTYKTQ